MDIEAISKIILTAEDKTAPGFDSAKRRVRDTADVVDELTKRFGATAAAAIKQGMDIERAFASELQTMQRARAEVANMQRQLDLLGHGNRDIARAILGTRGSLEISNEIQLINSALESLRRSANIGPQELARAAEAARVKVAGLRAEMEGAAAPAQGVERALSGVVGQLVRYVSVAAVIGGTVKLAQEFISTADGLKLLNARLAAVTGSAEEGKRAFAGLVEDSKRLRVPIEDAVGGFARIAASVKELGGTTTQARQLNEILLTTAKVSGIAGDEAAAAARQFAQALGSGVLQGDELRSIMENNQELARQLATGLGISIGELRKLGSEGKLTADVVSQALLSRLPEIQQRLKDVPLTTADAFTALRNEMTLFVDDADKATGASGRFAESLNGIASLIALMRTSGGIGAFFKSIEGVNVSEKGWSAVTERLNEINTASAQASVNLRAIENDMERSALGVQASAKRATEAVGKYADDLMSKQDQIRRKFTEQWSAIQTAIEAQKKVVEMRVGGTEGVTTALSEITRLEKLRADATRGMTKALADADAANAKHGTSIDRVAQELAKLKEKYDDIATADTSGLSVETVKAIKELDRVYAGTNMTLAEYARQVDIILAKDSVLAKEQRELAEAQKARVKVYDDEARARAAVLSSYDKSIDAIDAEAEKIRAQAEALGLSKEVLQAREVAILDNVIALKEQTLAELQSRDETSESIAMIERHIAALTNLRDARSGLQAAESNKASIEAQKKDYDDLYKYIDDVGRQAFAALTDRGGDAAKKITEVFKTQLLAFLYKLAVQPFVVNIAAAISGQGSPAAGIGTSLLGGGGGGLLDIFSNAGSTVSNFFADLDHGVGVIDSFTTALSTGGASLLSVVGIVGTVASLAYSLFAKSRGGPKDGGFASVGDISGIRNTDGDGRWFTPKTADADVTQQVQAISRGYQDAMKALGLTGGNVGFALGFDTDPKGKASDNVHAGAFLNGQQIYNAEHPDIGRDPNVRAETIALETKRILFAAIQASLGDAPAYIAKLFEGIDAATATSDQIDQILGTARALKLVVEASAQLGDAFAALSPEQIQQVAEAFGGLDAFVQSAAFINANFTTSAARLQTTTEQLTADFDALGITMPESHQAFLDLLGSFDLTTEEGRNLYASVSALAPAFVAVEGTADAAAAAARQLADDLAAFQLDNFLTDADRHAQAVADLDTAFKALGRDVPATHADFLKLLPTLGLTNEQVLDLERLYVKANGSAQEYADAIERENDARQAALAYFDQNFTPPAVRIQQFWDAVHAAWNSGAGAEIMRQGLGSSIPTTTEGFYRLVTSIDRTTEAGEQAYETLLKLAPTIVGLNDAVDGLTASAQAAADAANEAAQAQQQISDSYDLTNQRTGSGIDAAVAASSGGYAEKLALRLNLIRAAIDQYEAWIAEATPYGAMKFGQYLTILQNQNDAATKQLARFVELTVQYGEAKAEQLIQLEDWYTQQQMQFVGNTVVLDAFKAIFDEKWAAIINGTTSGVEDTLSQFEKLQQGIRDFVASLKTSDISALTPVQKLTEAKSQYDALLVKATGGDMDAMGKITSAAQEYLELARKYSPAGYPAVFDSVIAALESLATMEQPKTKADAALLSVLPTSGKLVSNEDLTQALDAHAATILAGLGQVAGAVNQSTAANEQAMQSQTQALTESGTATFK